MQTCLNRFHNKMKSDDDDDDTEDELQAFLLMLVVTCNNSRELLLQRTFFYRHDVRSTYLWYRKVLPVPREREMGKAGEGILVCVPALTYVRVPFVRHVARFAGDTQEGQGYAVML